MKKMIVRAATALLFFPLHTLAQTQISYSAKLESPDILETARAGTPQDVIVDFDDSGLENSIAARRVALHNGTEAKRKIIAAIGNSASSLDESEARDDDNLLQTLVTQLDSIKNSVLRADLSGRIHIVRDFPHISAAVVNVPDMASLEILLSNPGIKTIHPIKVSHILANWPSAYTDVSLIHSDIRNGVNGHKGAGTRVVVIDTGPYLYAVPGWDDTRSGCSAYNQSIPGQAGFTESWLANGGTAASANCRIWSFYDMTGKGICGAPVNADNTYNSCSTSAWQHATVIDDVIARVAPAAYITNLQIYDQNGTNTTPYSLAAFDWVISNHLQTPRIVAVNYSSEVLGSRYTSACTQSVFANRVSTLLSYNILTVVASGNSAYKNSVSEPACVPGVVSVGATTDSAVVAGSYGVCSDPALGVDQVACFSNSNSSLTSMFAPGVLIGSSVPVLTGDSTSSLRTSGTSVAAPHVAAAVAILEGDDAYGATKTASAIATMLTSNGPNVTDRLSAGVSKKRLDIAAALGNTAPPTLSRLVVSPTSLTLSVGASSAVSVTGYNQYGNVMSVASQSYTWSVPSVAAVSSGNIPNPVIVGNSAGSSILTITSSGVSAQLSVTVSGKSGPGNPDCKTNPAACR